MGAVDDGSSSPSAIRPRQRQTGQPIDITVRAAVPEDAHRIAQIGVTTFTEVFSESISLENIQKYLNENVNPSGIATYIHDPTKHFLVAEVDGRIEGFAQLTQGTTEPCLAAIETAGDKSHIELQRIYVEKSAQSLGVGKRLITAAEDKARDLGFRSIWLGVWEENFKGLAFYDRVGYREIGDHDFATGDCVQTDLILWKEL